jgi:hypothetical protein
LVSVPPRVRFPVLVTVPVRVRPLTVPVPPTDVTPEPAVDDTFTKSDPFQATAAFSFTAKVTPVVGPVPHILTVYVPDELITK